MAHEARLMMERQVTQLVRLVDDLLDISRITRNRLELRKTRVPLQTVLKSAVETSRPLIEQAGHTFSICIPDEPLYLDADLTRLAQVFSNLLNNAAKYTEPGGRLALTASVNEGKVEVHVQDNGVGIPADALPKVFDLFSQVTGNLERAQGGLGIGLSLVRRLVELHGGTVEAHSDGPGRGSDFLVRLPVDSAPVEAAELPSDYHLSEIVQRRILVVDDNEDAAASLKLMLELWGHQTLTVHDGLSAVRSAEYFRPDLILLDIGLPKLNGYDACRQIRTKPWSGSIQIIALTGWGQAEDRRRSHEAGFDHHLIKPIEPSTLTRILADLPPPNGNLALQERSLRVLVVDDRRDATHMLRMLLTADGHDVRTAADGPSALEAASEFQPDVALVDISLPGMSGLEIARRIRKDQKMTDMVLIAMTGFADERDRQRSMEAGFDHHLVKPTDIRIVRQLLASVPKKLS